MKSHVHFCWVFSFFAASCWHFAQAQMCRAQEYLSTEGRCLPCTECPPGEEPDRKCGFGEGLGTVCKPCSADTFSSSYGPELCTSLSRCEDKKRVRLRPGSAAADTLCGDCIPGYYSPTGERDPRTTCLPCESAPNDIPGCPGSRERLTRLARNAEASHRRDDKPPLNGTRDGKPEENATQYAVLAIVPVFCVMGLLGILFCNLLMKKGYHCTAQKDEEAAKAERSGNSSAYRIEDANEDTIGVLVRLITEKKRKCCGPGGDAEGLSQQTTHAASLQACEQVAAPASDPPHLPAPAPPSHGPGLGHPLWPHLHPLQPEEVAGSAALPGSGRRSCQRDRQHHPQASKARKQGRPAGRDHPPLRGQVPRRPHPRAEAHPLGSENHL